MNLTDRQLQVLYLVAAGLTDRQIATTLGIALTSVHTHVLRIRRVLGASNRSHAVFLAMHQNLINHRLAEGIGRAH